MPATGRGGGRGRSEAGEQKYLPLQGLNARIVARSGRDFTIFDRARDI
jgi:hypothetical protein